MYVGGGTAFFYAPYVFRPLSYGFCDFGLSDFLTIIKKRVSRLRNSLSVGDVGIEPTTLPTLSVGML